MSTPSAARAAVAALAAAVIVLAAAGCSLSDSTHHARAASSSTRTTVAPTRGGSPSTGQSPSSQPGAHAFAPTPLSPAPAATPAAAVLRRYALLYGNLCSCSRAPATLNELATLATASLASQLGRAALSARVAIKHGLPQPAQAVGTIASLELAPAHGRTRTGLVVLVERTAIAHQGTTAPAPAVYTAQLALTPDGWRVASFQPLRPNHAPIPLD